MRQKFRKCSISREKIYNITILPQKQKTLTGIILFLYCKTTDLANNYNVTYGQAKGRGSKEISTNLKGSW